MLLSIRGAKFARFIGTVEIGIGILGLISSAIIMISRGTLFWPPSLDALFIGIMTLGWAKASLRARQAETQLRSCTVNITSPTGTVVDAERTLQRAQQRLSRIHGTSR